MKKLICTTVLAASIVLSVVCNNASANLIVGPTSGYNIGIVGGSVSNTQPSTWGIQFTANQSSNFVSFDFNQKAGLTGSDTAGTINLKDVTSSTTIDTWDVPQISGPVAGTVTFSGFDDSLKSGDIYQLVYTQTAGAYSNEALIAIYSTHYTPYTNADITVTNGIENSTTSTGIWYAFGNLQTVPEPSTFAMLGLGGLVLAIRRRRTIA